MELEQHLDQIVQCRVPELHHIEPPGESDQAVGAAVGAAVRGAVGRAATRRAVQFSRQQCARLTSSTDGVWPSTRPAGRAAVTTISCQGSHFPPRAAPATPYLGRLNSIANG